VLSTFSAVFFICPGSFCSGDGVAVAFFMVKDLDFVTDKGYNACIPMKVTKAVTTTAVKTITSWRTSGIFSIFSRRKIGSVWLNIHSIGWCNSARIVSNDINLVFSLAV